MQGSSNKLLSVLGGGVFKIFFREVIAFID
jgi:hypothetical protein